MELEKEFEDIMRRAELIHSEDLRDFDHPIRSSQIRSVVMAMLEWFDEREKTYLPRLTKFSF